MEFDASIANTNTNNSSIFYIFTDQSNKNSYILKMSSPTYNNGRNNMKWFINDSEDCIELSTGFLHFKLNIDRTTNQIGLSIYSLDNTIILEKKLINKSSSATDIVKCFYMELSKGARGTIKLNNISVYSYEYCSNYSSFY